LTHLNEHNALLDDDLAIQSNPVEYLHHQPHKPVDLLNVAIKATIDRFDDETELGCTLD